ncbi:MAG: hypothetical protein AB8B74_09675 [Crocinitomicaceae bacterium]
MKKISLTTILVALLFGCNKVNIEQVQEPSHQEVVNEIQTRDVANDDLEPPEPIIVPLDILPCGDNFRFIHEDPDFDYSGPNPPQQYTAVNLTNGYSLGNGSISLGDYFNFPTGLFGPCDNIKVTFPGIIISIAPTTALSIVVTADGCGGEYNCYYTEPGTIITADPNDNGIEPEVP